MPGLGLLFAQLAAPAAASLPDIELRARVHADDVRIEQQGKAEARVHVEPSGGQTIDVQRNQPKGSSRYRNLEMTVQIDARLAEALGEVPQAAAPTEETEQGTDE